MNISEHITYEEAIRSEKAIKLKIDNTPNEEQLACMKTVAEYCFEPLRKWYDKPIKINSFFRNPQVNKAVNGSKTSDHMKGRAIDMDAGSREENLKLFNYCKANLKFDQLIWENDGAWVHISFNINGNRNDVRKLYQIVK